MVSPQYLRGLIFCTYFVTTISDPPLGRHCRMTPGWDQEARSCNRYWTGSLFRAHPPGSPDTYTTDWFILAANVKWEDTYQSLKVKFTTTKATFLCGPITVLTIVKINIFSFMIVKLCVEYCIKRNGKSRMILCVWKNCTIYKRLFNFWHAWRCRFQSNHYEMTSMFLVHIFFRVIPSFYIYDNLCMHFKCVSFLYLW